MNTNKEINAKDVAKTTKRHDSPLFSAAEIIEIVIKSLFIGGVMIFIAWFFFQMGKDAADTTREITSQSAAIEAVYEGEVTDKRIVNARSNVFRTRDTEYRIYITAGYEYDGEQKLVTKYFCVPESTYLAYNIGDHFNSHDFKLQEE
ncbi:MAG: hypothetical protein ACI4JS_06260 [Oscillospiraceae bacterium]